MPLSPYAYLLYRLVYTRHRLHMRLHVDEIILTCVCACVCVDEELFKLLKITSVHVDKAEVQNIPGGSCENQSGLF